MTQQLLSPVQTGRTTLANRVVVASFTHSRTGQSGDVPTELNVTHYTQRATAGLIATETTQISRQGQDYAWTPGMYTDAQEAGWKTVVDAVHTKGGRISRQF